MKTITQLISESPSIDPCPLWIKDATPETAFRDLVEHYLTQYKDYLQKERESTLELITENSKQVTETRKQIDYLQTLDITGMLEVLQTDIDINQDILKQVIRERAQYLAYLTGLVEGAKAISDPHTGILKEICALIKDFGSKYVKTTAEANRRFKAQYNALIQPSKLPEIVLRERFGAKRDLLAKDLGLLEAGNEQLLRTVELINRKLDEIQKIRKNVLKAI